MTILNILSKGNPNMSKERPILFSAPMVRALLGGSKTQTRRIMKKQPHDEWSPAGYGELHGFDKHGELTPDKIVGWGAFNEDGDQGYCCPYGQPGDRLWVRENFSLLPDHDEPAGHSQILYAADGDRHGKLKPSIHMPRWGCRILLEIASVRVERLQGISEPDAIAEGIEKWGEPHPRRGQRWNCPPHAQRFGEGDNVEDAGFAGGPVKDPREAYRGLWASINGADSWEANPWVWVVEFKRTMP